LRLCAALPDAYSISIICFCCGSIDIQYILLHVKFKGWLFISFLRNRATLHKKSGVQNWSLQKVYKFATPPKNVGVRKTRWVSTFLQILCFTSSSCPILCAWVEPYRQAWVWLYMFFCGRGALGLSRCCRLWKIWRLEPRFFVVSCLFSELR
jgi:hypothetical protein